MACGFALFQSHRHARGGVKPLGSGEVSRLSLITSPAVEVTEILGHADAAITAFHSALEADPELAEAHRGLGVAFAIQGHDEVAKLEYERYLGANPNASDASEIRAAINELNSRSKLDDSPR